MTAKINIDQCNIDTVEREEKFDKLRAHGCEKEYKANREAWFGNPGKHIVADYPLHVDLELASICNLHCHFCITQTEEFKANVSRAYMDPILFKRLIDESAENNLFSIRLSWIGEATLHPKFLELLRYAKEKGIPEVSMLTHGKKFSNIEFCEAVVDAKMDWITFSIDAMDEAYEAIRMPIKFEQIKQALRNLIETKKKRGTVKPAIKIQGVWPEVKKDLERYMETFVPLSDLIYTNPIKIYDEDIENDVEFLEEFTCYQPFQRLVIRANGDAFMCTNDDSGHHVMGNANESTIKEIWHGEIMTKVREHHINNEGRKHLTACAKCHLPRKRETETAIVQGRTVEIENY